MDKLKILLEAYYEMFGSGYPNMQLGNDTKMIKKCIDTGIAAEILYKDKLRDDVDY